MLESLLMSSRTGQPDIRFSDGNPTKPAVMSWDDFQLGMSVTFPFKVTAKEMEAFATLSGDYSRIHRDVDFAVKNGFSSTVVYGALTVAKLSKLVGMYLPGDLGLATEWKINFCNPLYVGDNAMFTGTVVHLSEATRIIKLKFSVYAEDKFLTKNSDSRKHVASGFAFSKLLYE